MLFSLCKVLRLQSARSLFSSLNFANHAPGCILTLARAPAEQLL